MLSCTQAHNRSDVHHRMFVWAMLCRQEVESLNYVSIHLLAQRNEKLLYHLWK